MDNSLKKILIAMMAIVIVAVMVGMALYVRSLPGAGEMTVKDEPEIVEEETFENVTVLKKSSLILSEKNQVKKETICPKKKVKREIYYLRMP